AREHAGGYAVGRLVRDPDRLVGIVHDRDGGDRPEGLLLAHGNVGRYVGQEGGFVASALHLAASENPRSVADRLIDPCPDPLQRLLVNEWADDRVHLAGTADLGAFGLVSHLVDELLRHGTLDDEPAGGQARLLLP